MTPFQRAHPAANSSAIRKKLRDVLPRKGFRAAPSVSLMRREVARCRAAYSSRGAAHHPGLLRTMAAAASIVAQSPSR